MSDARRDKAEELLKTGAEIAGAAAGGALGFFAAGPAGAAAGSVAGVLATKGLEMAAEFVSRSLSRREKVRVGAGIAYAFEKISLYLSEGREPRADNFFSDPPTGRSASDEILEGVLQKCKSEHEERKLRLIGNIYANVAFMENVLPAGANWLLQKAEELTYRQLSIISLVKRKGVSGASWGPQDGDPAFEREYAAIDDMFARDTSPQAYQHEREVGEPRPITGLSRIGEFCFAVMGLRDIPDEHLHDLAARFPGAFEPKESRSG